MSDRRELDTVDVIEKWCRAGQTADANAAADCCTPDVVLISPLTEQFRFRGQGQLRALLQVAFTTIEGIQFHTRVRESRTVALFYGATVSGQPLEEAQLLRLDESGLINEITLFGRPLPALTSLMAQLGPAMARWQHRNAHARFLAASTAPLTLPGAHRRQADRPAGSTGTLTRSMT